MNDHGQLITALARSETFQQYERAYTATTGMPLALRPLESWQLPFRGKRKENAFCALMAGQNRTCAVCLQLQEKLAQEAMNKATTTACAFGLCETAVPVKLGAQTIGFLQTGQVMRQKPTEAAFQRAVEGAANRGLDIDNEPTRRAYFKTPVVPPKKLEAVAGLLTSFADHLAVKCNQLVIQTANAESPVIARAKQFIAAHHMDNLTLAQVSRSVNMSRFYFCKQFRKATGLYFTEFVSRLRVEKAKTFLLNPNLRISEITFAAGFQSLTHFSRMFRKIVGESPTDYRAKLAGTSGFRLASLTRRYPHRETRPGGPTNGSGQNHNPANGRSPGQPPQIQSFKSAATWFPHLAPGTRSAARAR